jgi:hypothetical protein
MERSGSGSLIEAVVLAESEHQPLTSTSNAEKRKHPRLPVSVPVLCDALGLDGNPNDLHIGSIKEVSSAGITLELFTKPDSEKVNLSFIDDKNREIQIGARLVHSRINSSFKTLVGLSLQGSTTEMENFVARVVRTHQSSSCCAGQET